MEEHNKKLKALKGARRRAWFRFDWKAIERLDKQIEEQEATMKGIGSRNPNHHKRQADDVYLVEEQEVEQ